jgi:LysM repeat protein
MNYKINLVRLFLVISILSVIVGCQGDGNPVEETDEKQYQRGISLKRQAREKEALDAFLTVIKKRDKAPQSHLEAGKLYLHLMHDPLTARYHFEQYISIEGDSPDAPIIRDLMRTAEKEFLKNLPGKPFNTGINNFELKRKTEELQSENAVLQAELEKAAKVIGQLKENIAILNQQRATADSSTVRSIPSTPSLVDPEFAHENSSRAYNQRNEPVREPKTTTRMKTYRVISGDTLSKISQKIYGDRSYYKIIYQANTDQMKSENDLKVGQVLRIPIPLNR